MTSDILVVPDPHAHPSFNNDRADWLGKFILDRKPDVVVNMGDTFDMPSLSSYDKGKASFHGNSYEKDINAGLDFLDRMWRPIRNAKRKKPYSVFLEGNHENRLKRVLESEPQLSGDRFGVSYANYQLRDYHNEVVYYKGQTPGIFTCEGFSFAHYVVSGVMGRALSSVHHAAALIDRLHSSCVVAHSHTVDYAVRNTVSGQTLTGIVAGVYQDYESQWAGYVNQLWWPGLVYLHGAEDGAASVEFISLGKIRTEYGG